METSAINLIIDIILIFLILYLIFFKDYLKQKGRNLATKEDIGEITQIIEEVKFDLNKELELLKISQTRIQTYKTEIFSDYISLFTEILTKTKPDRRDDNKMRKLRYLIFLFASDETILEFKELNKLNEKDKNTTLAVNKLADFLISMRKDIGYIDTKLERDDLLSILINNWENIKTTLNK